MARRKLREGEGLHKVLGVPALFSTAYGNVGSSIYYALGIVAISAMGATPLVFVIIGMLFVTTAWTYAEATAAMPEAGGASSFARRAFNEFVSFGIGWGQMLVYTATIAISALFVPHYLSVFVPVLKEWPYNAVGGILVAVGLIVINVIGIKEAARLNIVLALLALATQVLIMIIALVLLLEPRILIEQIDWGVAPTWRQFLYGLAIGTDERARAAEVLQGAVALASQFKVKMNPIVITARSAGRAIVQQATERRSEVIILGVMKKRRFSERAFGGTTDHVIEHAPCEVLVNIVPPTGAYESGAKAAPSRVGGPRGGWLPASAEEGSRRASPEVPEPPSSEPTEPPSSATVPPDSTPPGVSTGRDDRDG